MVQHIAIEIILSALVINIDLFFAVELALATMLNIFVEDLFFYRSQLIFGSLKIVLGFLDFSRSCFRLGFFFRLLHTP